MNYSDRILKLKNQSRERECADTLHEPETTGGMLVFTPTGNLDPKTRAIVCSCGRYFWTPLTADEFDKFVNDSQLNNK